MFYFIFSQILSSYSHIPTTFGLMTYNFLIRGFFIPRQFSSSLLRNWLIIVISRKLFFGVKRCRAEIDYRLNWRLMEKRRKCSLCTIISHYIITLNFVYRGKFWKFLMFWVFWQKYSRYSLNSTYVLNICIFSVTMKKHGKCFRKVFGFENDNFCFGPLLNPEALSSNYRKSYRIWKFTRLSCR